MQISVLRRHAPINILLPHSIPAAVGLSAIFLSCSGIQAASPDDSSSIPISVSRNGSTGLIRTSTADVMPDGDFEFSTHSLLPLGVRPRIGDSAYAGINVGFLPRVEFGLQLGAPNQSEDLAGNIKYQLLPEHGALPAVSIGGFDLKSNFLPNTYYVAATRHFFNGRVGATIGGQQGGYGGAYGGLEVGVLPHLTGMVEYDTKDINYGVKAAFLNNRAMVYAQHVRAGWTINLAARLRLGIGESTPAAVTLPQLTTPLDAAAAVNMVQSRLVHMGLENVTARVGSNNTMDVTYENRSFPHTEMDALANVLASMAVYAPTGVTNIQATALRQNNPVVQVACTIQDYRDFMAGKLSADQFADHFTAVYTAHPPKVTAAMAQTREGARSYGHADLYVRPGAQAQIGTEQYTLGIALAIRPELYIPLAHGLDFDTISNIPVGDTFGIQSGISNFHPNFQARNPTFERADVGFTWRPTDSLVSRTLAGKFPGSLTGEYTELYYLPGDTRWMVRGSAGALNQENGPRRNIYTGRVRYYYPKLDLTAEAVGGQFLLGDTGYGFDLVRRFDQTDIGLQYRSTSIGKVGALFVTVPIGPSHLSQRPSFFRVRPADYFSYAQETLLTRPNYTSIALATANEPRVGTPGILSTLDNGRLNPSYIRRSLNELRRARLFELGPP